MFEVIGFLKKELKKLFLYIMILIGINILIFSIIVFKLNATNKMKDTLYSVSEGINLYNKGYVVSEKASKTLEKNNLWAILIDKSSGEVIWEYKKPQGVNTKFNINDVALFSKFYLNDYPVFLKTREDGLLVLAFPKDSYVRYNANYFSYNFIKNMPSIVLFYVLGNIIILLMLMLFTHFKLAKEIKPLNNAILSIPNNIYYTTDCNNSFEQIYKSINKINKLLNNSEKERELWIESISHDIRTPLSNIIGFAASLSNNSELDDKDKFKVGQIEKHGKYIRELISNLNINTKLNNEYKLKLQKINFIPFVKNTIINIINENENPLYNIEFLVDENIKNEIYVNVDIVLFERLIRNVIYNSIKHNINGCDLFVEMHKLNSKVHIIFKDNGIGSENIEYIVENIENKKNNYSSLNKLGLFIVSRIIKLHNGEMKIQSEKGVFFMVELIMDISEE